MEHGQEHGQGDDNNEQHQGAMFQSHSGSDEVPESAQRRPPASPRKSETRSSSPVPNDLAPGHALIGGENAAHTTPENEENTTPQPVSEHDENKTPEPIRDRWRRANSVVALTKKWDWNQEMEDGNFYRYWNSVLRDLQREKKRSIASKGQHYTHTSCFCIPVSSQFRFLAIQFVEWPWFDRFILLLILLNCCISVLEDGMCQCQGHRCSEYELYTRMLYTGKNCDYYPVIEEFLKKCDVVFTTFFAFEMLVKVIARGFILHKHAYLRDKLNWLDFVVVVTSILSAVAEYLPESSYWQQIGFASILRLVKVLRPLRTMTRIPGMTTLIVTLARSVQGLTSVLKLLFFLILVFGTVFVELFSGSFRGRCFVDPSQNLTTAAKARLESQQYPYLVNDDPCSVSLKLGSCNPLLLDGNFVKGFCRDRPLCAGLGADGKLLWTTCRNDWMSNPDTDGRAYLNYDNIFSAVWLLFCHITMEGWTDSMYSVGADSIYIQWMSRVLHVMWILIGSSFVMQLALGIISEKYFGAQEEAKTMRARIALDVEAVLHTQKSAEAQAHIAQLKREAAMTRSEIIMASFEGVVRILNCQQITAPMKRAGRKLFDCIPGIKGLDRWLRCMLSELRRYCRVVVENRMFSRLTVVSIVLNTICMALPYYDHIGFEETVCQRRCYLDPRLPANATCYGPLFNRTFDIDSSGQKVRYAQKRSFCFLDNNPVFPDSELCSKKLTSTECLASAENCFWVPRWQPFSLYSLSTDYSCKLGLYSSKDFGIVGNKELGLRQLCGDDNDNCPIEDPSDRRLDVINEVCTWIFIFEMVLYMIGSGVLSYFNDNWRCFDFFVVALSIIEMIDVEDSSGSFSALRSFRLARLIKLLRHWPSMQKMLATLGSALKDQWMVVFIFVLFLYIFALIGMIFFTNQFKLVKTEYPRSNFDTFFPSPMGQGALMTVFQIITGENWTAVMYDCIKAGMRLGTIGWILGLFPVIIVFVGNYIVINLFISILLSKMDADQGQLAESTTTRTSSVESLSTSGFSFLRGLSLTTVLKSKRRVHEDPAVCSSAALVAQRLVHAKRAAKKLALRSASMHSLQKASEHEDSENRADLESEKHYHVASTDHLIAKIDIKDTFFKLLAKSNGEQRIGREYVFLPNHNSCGVLSPKNSFRLLLAYVLHKGLFDKFILVCILISSITLLIEAANPTMSVMGTVEFCPMDGLDCRGYLLGNVSSPNTPEDYLCPAGHIMGDPFFGAKYGECGSDTEHACCSLTRIFNTLKVMDILFTIIFLVEMVGKIMIDGIILHELAYFRDFWNILDAIVAIVSLVSIILQSNGSKALKATRAMRVLRSLKVIKRHPQLKICVLCVLKSLSSMANVFLVVIFYIFILGMTLKQGFQGRFFRCFDPQGQRFYGSNPYIGQNPYPASLPLSGPTSIPSIVECVSKTNGLGVWRRTTFHFDSTWRGMITLFEMMTTEGWLHVEASLMDATEEGTTPLPNNFRFMAFFCFFHIYVGTYILLNMAVSSIISNYIILKNLERGITGMLTDEQREWVETQKLILNLMPRTRRRGPDHPVRAFFYRISTSGRFDAVITLCVFGNFICMLSRQHQDTCETTARFIMLNVGFVVIFLSEAIMKLIGLGPTWYFHDGWNKADFAIVILSCITCAVDLAGGRHICHGDSDRAEGLGALGSTLRAIRVLRVFRLIRRAKSITKLIGALLSSIPALFNICLLIFLVLYIFGVLGTIFFWNVNVEQPEVGISGGKEGANYSSFNNSVWLLMRQMTGETWNYIMYACAQSDLTFACEQNLDEYMSPFGCGGPWLGEVFHVVWQFLGTLLMMQLVAAVVLENFNDLVRGEKALISKEHLDEFVDAWNRFDPDAQGYMLARDVPKLICALKPPLGVMEENHLESVTYSKCLLIAKDLDIPVRGITVRYTETILGLVRRAQIATLSQEEEIMIIDSDSDSDSSQEGESNMRSSPGTTQLENEHVGDAYAKGTEAGSSHQRFREEAPHHRHEHAPKSPRKKKLTKTSATISKLTITKLARNQTKSVIFRGRRATIAEDFAARLLQGAYREWREHKVQLHKGDAFEESIHFRGSNFEEGLRKAPKGSKSVILTRRIALSTEIVPLTDRIIQGSVGAGV